MEDATEYAYSQEQLRRWMENVNLNKLRTELFVYIDGIARADVNVGVAERMYAHLYEHGEEGNPRARLFRIDYRGRRMSIRLVSAKKPNILNEYQMDYGVTPEVWPARPFVVEAGKSVTIRPRVEGGTMILGPNPKSEDRKPLALKKPVTVDYSKNRHALKKSIQAFTLSVMRKEILVPEVKRQGGKAIKRMRETRA